MNDKCIIVVDNSDFSSLLTTSESFSVEVEEGHRPASYIIPTFVTDLLSTERTNEGKVDISTLCFFLLIWYRRQTKHTL